MTSRRLLAYVAAGFAFGLLLVGRDLIRAFIEGACSR